MFEIGAIDKYLAEKKKTVIQPEVEPKLQPELQPEVEPKTAIDEYLSEDKPDFTKPVGELEAIKPPEQPFDPETRISAPDAITSPQERYTDSEVPFKYTDQVTGKSVKAIDVTHQFQVDPRAIEIAKEANYGLFQIDSKQYSGLTNSRIEDMSPRENINFAKLLVETDGWEAFSSYRDGSYKNFMDFSDNEMISVHGADPEMIKHINKTFTKSDAKTAKAVILSGSDGDSWMVNTVADRKLMSNTERVSQDIAEGKDLGLIFSDDPFDQYILNHEDSYELIKSTQKKMLKAEEDGAPDFVVANMMKDLDKKLEEKDNEQVRNIANVQTRLQQKMPADSKILENLGKTLVKADESHAKLMDDIQTEHDEIFAPEEKKEAGELAKKKPEFEKVRLGDFEVPIAIETEEEIRKLELDIKSQRGRDFVESKKSDIEESINSIEDARQKYNIAHHFHSEDVNLWNKNIRTVQDLAREKFDRLTVSPGEGLQRVGDVPQVTPELRALTTEEAKVFTDDEVNFENQTRVRFAELQTWMQADYERYIQEGQSEEEAYQNALNDAKDDGLVSPHWHRLLGDILTGANVLTREQRIALETEQAVAGTSQVERGLAQFFGFVMSVHGIGAFTGAPVANSLGKALYRSPKLQKALGALEPIGISAFRAGRALQGIAGAGVTFGIHTAIGEIIDTEKPAVEKAKTIRDEILFWSGVGGIGAGTYSKLAQLAIQPPFVYLASKLRGDDTKEALINAGVFALFTLAQRKSFRANEKNLLRGEAYGLINRGIRKGNPTWTEEQIKFASEETFKKMTKGLTSDLSVKDLEKFNRGLFKFIEEAGQMKAPEAPKAPVVKKLKPKIFKKPVVEKKVVEKPSEALKVFKLRAPKKAPKKTIQNLEADLKPLGLTKNDIAKIASNLKIIPKQKYSTPEKTVFQTMYDNSRGKKSDIERWDGMMKIGGVIQEKGWGDDAVLNMVDQDRRLIDDVNDPKIPVSKQVATNLMKKSGVKFTPKEIEELSAIVEGRNVFDEISGKHMVYVFKTGDLVTPVHEFAERFLEVKHALVPTFKKSLKDWRAVYAGREIDPGASDDEWFAILGTRYAVGMEPQGVVHAELKELFDIFGKYLDVIKNEADAFAQDVKEGKVPADLTEALAEAQEGKRFLTKQQRTFDDADDPRIGYSISKRTPAEIARAIDTSGQPDFMAEFASNKPGFRTRKFTPKRLTTLSPLVDSANRTQLDGKMRYRVNVSKSEVYNSFEDPKDFIAKNKKQLTPFHPVQKRAIIDDFAMAEFLNNKGYKGFLRNGADGKIAIVYFGEIFTTRAKDLENEYKIIQAPVGEFSYSLKKYKNKYYAGVGFGFTPDMPALQLGLDQHIADEVFQKSEFPSSTQLMKIPGAPANPTNFATLLKMVNTTIMEHNSYGRDWYKDFGQKVADLVGVENMQEEAILFAKTSPRTTVFHNYASTLFLMRMARLYNPITNTKEYLKQIRTQKPLLKIGTKDPSGQLIKPDGRKVMQASSEGDANRIVQAYRDGTYSSKTAIKTTSFAQSVLRSLDNTFMPFSVTDVHMARALGYSREEIEVKRLKLREHNYGDWLVAQIAIRMNLPIDATQALLWRESRRLFSSRGDDVSYEEAQDYAELEIKEIENMKANGTWQRSDEISKAFINAPMPSFEASIGKGVHKVIYSNLLNKVELETVNKIRVDAQSKVELQSTEDLTKKETNVTSKALVKKYGITNDIMKGGFILHDGNMLNMYSEKNVSPSMPLRKRNVEHRDVEFDMPKDWHDRILGHPRSSAMPALMKTGYIRMSIADYKDWESGKVTRRLFVQIDKKPNSSQMQSIEHIMKTIRKSGNTLAIEVAFGDKVRGNSFPNQTEALNAIKSHFISEPKSASIIRQFHYSLAKEPNENIEKDILSEKKMQDEKVTKPWEHEWTEIEGEWFANRDEAELRSNVWIATTQKRIQDTVPKKVGKKRKGKIKWIREWEDIDRAIMFYIDTKIDPSHADEFRNSISKKDQKILKLSENLTKEQIAIADMALAESQNIGALAKEAGLIQNIIENHVNRTWEFDKKTTLDSAMNNFGTFTRHSLQRSLSTILEGLSKGYTLKIQGISNSIGTMQREIVGVVENKKLIDSGRKTVTESGEYMFSFEPSEGYKLVDVPAFTDWRYSGTVSIPTLANKMLEVHKNAKIKEPKPIDALINEVKNSLMARGRNEHEADIIIKKLQAKDTTKEDVSNILEEDKKPVLDEEGNVIKYGLLHRAPGMVVLYDGTILRKKPLYAPEKIANDLSKTLGYSSLYKLPGVEFLTVYNDKIKRIILTSALFHHLAFTRSFLFGGALKLKDINIRKSYKRGLQAIENLTPEIVLLTRNGLTLSRVQDWNELQVQSQSRLSKKMDKLNVLPEFRERISLLQRTHTKMLFQRYGAGLKALTALREYQHMLKTDPDLSPDKRAYEVGLLVNADFGGLHTKRMHRNPTLQHFLRLFFLAPDWTESNIISMIRTMKTAPTTKAMGDAMTRAERRLFRRFWARIVMRAGSLTVLGNLLMGLWSEEEESDEYLERIGDRFKRAWDKGSLRFLEVDYTPLYHALGGDPELIAYMSILGHFRDPIKFAVHPIRSMIHKQSVLASVAMSFFSGRDWRGRPYTTLAEILGIDEKGTYATTRKGFYKKGDPKGGKLKWKTTAGAYAGAPGYVTPTRIPSWALNRLRGFLPIPIQNTLSWASGEMDGVTAILKSLGLHTTATMNPDIDDYGSKGDYHVDYYDKFFKWLLGTATKPKKKQIKRKPAKKIVRR